MKYKDFHAYLTIKVGTSAIIGPSISIKVGNNPSISMSKLWSKSSSRYIIFPIKIYGENIRHLNVLLLDQKTKIIERYEPFNLYLNFHQINDLLEPLLYKLMEQKKIYFLKYQTTLNTEVNLNEQNCGLYCVQYIVEKISNWS
jgi:hypothetical protein